MEIPQMQVKGSRVKRQKVSNDTGWNINSLTSLLIGLYHSQTWAHPSENTAGKGSLERRETSEKLEICVHPNPREYHMNTAQEHISIYRSEQQVKWLIKKKSVTFQNEK